MGQLHWHTQWWRTKETLSPTRWKPRMDTHSCPLTVIFTATLTWYVLRFMSKNTYLSLSKSVVFLFHLPDVVFFKHFMDLFSCMCVHPTCHRAHVEVRGQFVGSRFYDVSSMDWTQVIKFGNKDLHPLNHLICHFLCFLSMSPNPPKMEKVNFSKTRNIWEGHLSFIVLLPLWIVVSLAIVESNWKQYLANV